MGGIKDSDNIDKLRERLYERGRPVSTHEQHKLQDEQREVPTAWQRETTGTQHDMRQADKNVESIVPPTPVGETPSPSSITMTKIKKTHYRLKIVMVGVLLFSLSLIISIGIMIFGNNNYSGKNITIDVNGPFTIGGGEVMPVQVAITNGNDIDIESATLIVEYFPGTVSAGDKNEQLFIERLPLDMINAGETISVPLRAIVFGEENEEQAIKVSIEYRTRNSNARLYKEAEPLRYKISSSPVSITAEALKKISSGQATDVTITIKSNAPTTLSEVLVRAEYPIGFDYESSDPKPYAGENAWLIKDLKPESSQTIVISGVVVGKETDEYAINFTVGIPDERNSEQIRSLFGTAQTQFEIEQPFLNVALTMGNVVNDTKVVESDQPVNASVEITNTLKDTIYDIVVKVKLNGNAVADLQVGPPSGFYDSRTDTITWDVSNSPELSELKPNDSTRVSFTVEPDTKTSNTPEVTMDVEVQARRVRESQVAENLIGTASGAIRVISEPNLSSTATYSTGPLPPKAETETTYNVRLSVKNGSNDIADTVVTAVLPTYVSWKDVTSGSGKLTYNSTNHVVTWSLGSVSANETKNATFRIGITPSKTQIGQTPIIVGEQQLRADDRFTGTTVRDTYPARTTEMGEGSGYESQNGRVVE